MSKYRLARTVLICSLFVSMAISQNNPTISRSGAIDDSVITVYYKVPARMFLEISIASRQGFIIDVPLAKEISVSEDSIKLKVADYRTGTYFIQTKVNHSSSPISMKIFRHCKPGEIVTFSPEEQALHNKLPACDSSVCTIAELSSFDLFFKKYPHYLDKGEVLERALLAYVRLDQDSLLISKTVDTLVTYLPTFWTYYTIARYLIENNKLSSLGSKYLLKARDGLSVVPISLRDEYDAKLAALEAQVR